MMDIRRAADHDLDAYVAVWNAITPDEPADAAQQRERRERDRRRLYLLAERGGEVVGCGFAGPSQSEGRGFLSPRVLPGARRAGVGTALLRALAVHLTGLGFTTASAHVDGKDGGSLAFADRFRFEEADRQVEQVLVVSDPDPTPFPPDGVVFVTLADRPELLRESYPLATEGYADMAVYTAVTISLDDWLAGDDANLPEGSFVALAGEEIVGLSGLCRNPDGAVEDGLTVVRRDWRRRGLAERSSGRSSRGRPRTASSRCDVDADRQRGDADLERAARLHGPQRQHHGPGRTPDRLRRRRAPTLREHRLVRVRGARSSSCSSAP